MFLVLHGQTEWNRDGRLQGHADAPLTDEGRRQSLLVGKILKSRLADPAAARLVASPLGRTQATARIVAEALGLPPGAIHGDARLAELRLGAWEGLTREQIRARWPERMAGAMRNAWYFQAPDGESYDAIAARLGDWLAGQGEHGTLVAVSHGIASRVLRGLYGGLTRDAAVELDVARDAVFWLRDGGCEKLSLP